MKIKKIKIALSIVLGLIIAIVVSFLAWSALYYKASEDALRLLESDENILVLTDKDLVFIPRDKVSDTGLIFYPGGKVEEKAYSYLGHALATEGYKTFIVKMPLRLAVLSPAAAQDIIRQEKGIDRWVIAGHSLGGSMAADFAYKNPDMIDGLVLIASYPASSSDISYADLEVLSIYGDRDGIADSKKIMDSFDLLPAENTTVLEIKGANHSQFGDYGFQDGDLRADISPEEQHRYVIEAITELLETISK